MSQQEAMHRSDDVAFEAGVVRDAADLPMMLYHGTAAPFEDFDLSKAGANFPCAVGGLFFTNRADEAARYADRAHYLAVTEREDYGAAERVIPAHISLARPLVIRDHSRRGYGAIELIESPEGLLPEVRRALDGEEFDGVIAVDLGSPLTTGGYGTLVIAKRADQIRIAMPVTSAKAEPGLRRRPPSAQEEGLEP